MTHLYKISLQTADMFVRSIDLKTQLIEYQVHERDGKAMEPIKKDTYLIHNGNIIFDKNRDLPLEFVEYISSILNSD